MAVIAAPLTLTSNLPIDNREVVASLQDLNTLSYPYAGLEVWVENEAKKYRCVAWNATDGATWIDLSQALVNLEDYYTKTEVDDLLNGLTKINFKLVNSLPSRPSAGEENFIYLVPSTQPGANNAKDEYIYISNSWEKIGSTEVNLSNYATLNYAESQANTAYTNAIQYVDEHYYNKEYIDGLSASVQQIEDDDYLLVLH